jgi:cytochrome c heme-lyase
MPHTLTQQQPQSTPTPGGGGGKQVYNVYAQPIDPTNQMPANPNQKPAPGQAAPLSTERVASGIPKGGTRETWTYPSPQMFWNALTRKGKAEGAKEEDMDVVVAIHNNMNENTWRQVLEWERLHQEEHKAAVPDGDATPRLSRFMGKPDDISPKAWFKSVFGCVGGCALRGVCGSLAMRGWVGE